MIFILNNILVSDQYSVSADTHSTSIGIGIGREKMVSEHLYSEVCRDVQKYVETQKYVEMFRSM